MSSEATMRNEHEVAALIQQAARNLEALEQFVRASADEVEPVSVLRQRLERLKAAYTSETDALTRYAIHHAIERRRGLDRRRSGREVS